MKDIYPSFAFATLLSIISTGTALAHDGETHAPASPATTTPAALPEHPSDAQIAGIVVTANAVDIEAGQLALATSKRKTIQQFAQRMITDHGGVNIAASGLVSKLGVTPADSATSTTLKSGGDDNITTLKGLSGKAFDRAYVRHEVGYHQAVLDEIDDVLIPDAQNAELKALLVQVRPAIAAHLAHAKMIKAQLK
jgi:putative membrane protein